MAIEGINIDVYQFLIILVMIMVAVMSPLIAFSLKQKSKVEKLEILREADRKDFDEHMKHSELQSDLLSKISETVSVFKYMLERMESDIQEIKSDARYIRKNGGDKRSPI